MANVTHPPQTAAEIQRRKTASNFFDACTDTVGYLYSRWLDESNKYEDINDYQKPLDQIVKKFPGIKITQMTKRPFGFKFTLSGCTYRVFATIRRVAYRRIA